MTDTVIELASGRKIGVSGFGDPTAHRVVVFCNPTPGSGAFDPDPLVTDRHGVRVVAIDRPGYGGSEGWGDESLPSVQVAAEDIREYLELSGIARRTPADKPAVGVVGWGWGAASALCFAARNPKLVSRVAIVSAVRPARTRRGERSPRAAELLRPRYISSVSGAAASLSQVGGPTVTALGFDPDDSDLSELGAAGRVESLVTRSQDPDLVGLAFDRLTARDTRWSDELAHLSASTLVIRGDRDPVATPEDAKWYRRHVPHSRLVTAPGSGRLAIIPQWDAILRHVAADVETLKGSA